jgi:hypothetical protein
VVAVTVTVTVVIAAEEVQARLLLLLLLYGRDAAISSMRQTQESVSSNNNAHKDSGGATILFLFVDGCTAFGGLIVDWCCREQARKQASKQASKAVGPKVNECLLGVSELTCMTSFCSVVHSNTVD